MTFEEARSALGVSRQATNAEIKAAWKRAALRWHPDRSGGSDGVYKRINEAYQVLTGRSRADDELEPGVSWGRAASSGPTRPASSPPPPPPFIRPPVEPHVPLSFRKVVLDDLPVPGTQVRRVQLVYRGARPAVQVDFSPPWYRNAGRIRIEIVDSRRPGTGVFSGLVSERAYQGGGVSSLWLFV